MQGTEMSVDTKSFDQVEKCSAKKKMIYIKFKKRKNNKFNRLKRLDYARVVKYTRMP